MDTPTSTETRPISERLRVLGSPVSMKVPYPSPEPYMRYLTGSPKSFSRRNTPLARHRSTLSRTVKSRKLSNHQNDNTTSAKGEAIPSDKVVSFGRNKTSFNLIQEPFSNPNYLDEMLAEHSKENSLLIRGQSVTRPFSEPAIPTFITNHRIQPRQKTSTVKVPSHSSHLNMRKADSEFGISLRPKTVFDSRSVKSEELDGSRSNIVIGKNAIGVQISPRQNEAYNRSLASGLDLTELDYPEFNRPYTSDEVFARIQRRSKHDKLASMIPNIGNPEEMKKCLQIQQTRNKLIDDASLRMKLFTEYGESHLNHGNKPDRSGKTEKDKRKYIFNSVDSYLNYNSLIKTLNRGDSVIPPGLVRLPNPETDTVLIELMYGIKTKPRSGYVRAPKTSTTDSREVRPVSPSKGSVVSFSDAVKNNRSSKRHTVDIIEETERIGCEPKS